MQLMNIEELIPHKRNSEFFDDMSGEKWQEFLESIKTSGVIEPIVITQDKVIVSGHQRVRACKELGITEILAETKHYNSEDDVIKDLLETNIRQRGTVGGSEKKLTARIDELKRIYGIRNGGNKSRVGLSNSGDSKTFDQILADEGIDRATYFKAKKLQSLSPEIQQLIEEDKISATTAYKLIAKLSDIEQEQLIQSLPVAEKLTQKQVQSYVDKLKETQSQMNTYKTKAEKSNELQSRITKLESEIKELEQRKPVLQVKEVVPDDYNAIKSDNITLASDNASLRSDNARMVKEYKAKCQELFDLKDKLKAIEEDSTKNKIENELKSDCIFFCAKCDDFMKKVGGYAYLSDKLNSLPEMERKSYLKCIQMISAWADNIMANIDIEHN